MKLLLLYPPFSTHFVTPPIGLGYLAAYLEENNIDVKLIDCNLEKYGYKETDAEIENYKPDIIGFTLYTSFYGEVFPFIKRLKKAFPHIPIVLGGPHPSALIKETLSLKEIDFIVFGEGEKTVVELVRNLNNPEEYKNIKGLAFKKDNEIIINQKRPLIKNLNELPMLAWHFIAPNKYPKRPHGSMTKAYPVAPVILSRGCPFGCTFCGSKTLWGRTWRYRDPKKVVDEIEYLVKNYGVKDIHFEDDNFTLKKDVAMQVCDEIIKRKLNISFALPNGIRVDTIDDEILAKMKKAGCYSLVFGIESGSDEILKSIKKETTLEKIENAVNLAKKHKIQATGFFIIGLPNDTSKTMQQTIEFAKTIPLDKAQFGIFTPLPGSEDFEEWLKKENIEVRDIDWNRFDFYTPIYKLENVRDEEIKIFQKKAFRSFYLRPKIIFNIIRNIHASELIPINSRLLKIFRKKNEK